MLETVSYKKNGNFLFVSTKVWNILKIHWKNPATMRRYNSYQCLHKLEECGGGNCFNEIQDKYLCWHLFFQWGNLKGGGVRSQFFLLLESFVHSYSRSGLKARSLKEEVKRKLCDYNGPQSPDTGHTVIYDWFYFKTDIKIPPPPSPWNPCVCRCVTLGRLLEFANIIQIGSDEKRTFLNWLQLTNCTI